MLRKMVFLMYVQTENVKLFRYGNREADCTDEENLQQEKNIHY